MSQLGPPSSQNQRSVSPRVSPKASPQRTLPPLGLSLRDEQTPAARGAAASHSSGGGGGGNLTEEEKKVLATTSMINGREYVPFLSVVSIDIYLNYMRQGQFS